MKLHIGGEQVKEGWKILNIQKKDGVDYVGDISDLSQFKDNSIEEIYASHVFEHVKKRKIKDTLIGIHRVINENGKFYVSVPDLKLLCKIFIDPKATMFLLGSTMDYRTDKLSSRFVFDNPNEKSTCGCGESFKI